MKSTETSDSCGCGISAEQRAERDVPGPLAGPPHSRACAVNLKEAVFRTGREQGKGGRSYGANVLQPEPQNCDPPRRALLEDKKKKSRMASQGFLFSMYIKAIVSVQVAVFQALRFKFCSM